MKAVRKRHRDALRALRFCRSAMKLTFIFGVVVFAAMAIRIILIEFPQMDLPYAAMARDVIYITSGIYSLFLAGSAIVVCVIYYLFKKHNVSTRMFRIKDLVLFLSIEVVVLAATAYISYTITAGD
ncbi:MAG: hypothetical protein ACO1N9_10655 [Flavobacterium sp.]